MTTQLPSQKALPSLLGTSPPEGPKAFSINFDFSPTGQAQQYLTFNAHDYGVSGIQTLFIDNSNSSASTSFQVQGSAQKISCPPYSQGFFPIVNVGPSMALSCASTGGVFVPVLFMNTFVEMMVWSVQTPGSVVGTVTVTGTVIVQPLGGGYANKNGAITLGGTSQLAIGANGARKRFFIQNPLTAAAQGIAGAEALYIGLTTAATVNDGQSIELQPGQIFDTGVGPVTTEPVNVNAATTGHRYIAREM